MGVTAGDYLHEGDPFYFQNEFSDELETLYHNQGNGNFQNVTVAAGMGHNTVTTPSQEVRSSRYSRTNPDISQG